MEILYESAADVKNVTDELVNKFFNTNDLKKAIVKVVEDICYYAIECAEEGEYKSINDMIKALPDIAYETGAGYYDVTTQQIADKLTKTKAKAIYQILCTVDPDFKNDSQKVIESSEE